MLFVTQIKQDPNNNLQTQSSKRHTDYDDNIMRA